MSKQVMVFGSFNMDISSRVNRFPEPGETVRGSELLISPGGKGSNQAIAAIRAGANVSFVTKLGCDLFAKQAMDFFKEENILDDGIFFDENDQTGVALITVNENSGENKITAVVGACESFTEEEVDVIISRLDQVDILLLQLETNIEPVEKLLKSAKQHGILTILNPAPAQEINKECFKYIDIFTPNETEAQFFTGVQISDEHSIRQAANILIDKGISKIVITLGSSGAYARDGLAEKSFDIVDCGPAVDTTGAGDAFSGGLVAGLAEGLDFFEAIRYGSIVAGLAVTRSGAAMAMPHQYEIEEILKKR